MSWYWFALLGAVGAPLFVMPREVVAAFRGGVLNGVAVWSGMSMVLGIPILLVFWLLFGR